MIQCLSLANNMFYIQSEFQLTIQNLFDLCQFVKSEPLCETVQLTLKVSFSDERKRQKPAGFHN